MLAGKINRFYLFYIRKYTVFILFGVIGFVLGLIFFILLFYPEPDRWQNVITLMAVLTSLSIGVLPEFRRWNDRSFIDLSFDRGLDSINDESKTLHLKITNIGKTTARNVNVRVVDHFKAFGKETDPHYLLHDVDLQNNYSRTVLFFRIFPEESRIYSKFYEDDRWYDDYNSLEEDENLIEVLVTGDNFPAKKFFIYLNRKEDWKDTDFKIIPVTKIRGTIMS